MLTAQAAGPRPARRRGPHRPQALARGVQGPGPRRHSAADAGSQHLSHFHHVIARPAGFFRILAQLVWLLRRQLRQGALRLGLGPRQQQ